MFHEVYAPCTVADLAWSRQKAVALSTLIEQARKPPTFTAAAVPPRVTLLYGPPGCGKLESLQVLLRDDVPPTASAAAAAAKSSASTQRSTSGAPASTPPTPHTESCHTVYHVFHTCEATVHTYAQYLQRVLTCCRGQVSGAELPLTPLRAGAGPSSVPSSSAPRAGAQGGPSPSVVSPLSLAVHHAHIVKCYGEPASHALHHCNLLFLREYEELRAMAQREVQQGPLQLPSSSSPAQQPSRPGRLMDHLRRNLVFFVHTTHDTHNDKLDLNTSFPVAFLQSPAVEQFHCTAVTEINLRKRLHTIVGLEAQRRLQHRADEDVRGTPLPPPLAPNRGKRAKAHVTRKASVPNAPAPSASADLIDGDTLSAIAAGSQGDIRQALLQVQWTCLCPPPSRSCTATSSTSQSLDHARADEAAACIWARLAARRAALRHGADISGSDAAAAGAGTMELCATGSPVHADSKDNADDSGSIGTPEVTVISSSSSSSATSSPATSPLQSRADYKRIPMRSDGGVSGASRKRPRAAAFTYPPPSTPSTSQLVPDMLLLTDWQVDPVVEGRHAPPSGASGSRGGGAAQPRSLSSAVSATPSSSCAPSQQQQQQQQPQERSVLPTTRDEYLGLSHAVGRLLTQKYKLAEVLDILNVPPRKILDYLANNQIRYFADEQLASCAACTDAASDADALQASEMNASYASGAPNAAAVRERRQLSDRTNAGESEGNTGRLLDVIALHAFYAAYCAIHREVRPPPGFVAQEPPPLLRAAYPRLRDTGAMSGRWRRARAEGAGWMARGGGDADGDGATVPLSEQEWAQHAMLRLGSAAHSPAAASRGGKPRRRISNAFGGGGGAAAAGTAAAASAADRSADPATPRIQAEEVDIVREGLPGALQRCGSTDAALLDYYALAPYIVLTVDPPTAPAYGSLPTLSPAPLPQSAATSSRRVQASLVFNSVALPGGAAESLSAKGPRAPPSPPPAEACAASAAPRRTVFRFAPSTPSSLAASTPPPVQQRTCTPLQLAILQRGYTPATAQLRDALFVLGTDGAGGGTDVVEGAAVDPLTAHVDEIEEVDDD